MMGVPFLQEATAVTATDTPETGFVAPLSWPATDSAKRVDNDILNTSANTTAQYSSTANVYSICQHKLFWGRWGC
jgi:hypothetical protein